MIDTTSVVNEIRFPHANQTAILRIRELEWKELHMFKLNEILKNK